jgi:hypothetical protein
MYIKAKNELQVSLANAIEAWWDKESIHYIMPCLGDNVLDIMAESALLVLFAIAETTEYLESQDMLKK